MSLNTAEALHSIPEGVMCATCNTHNLLCRAIYSSFTLSTLVRRHERCRLSSLIGFGPGPSGQNMTGRMGGSLTEHCKGIGIQTCYVCSDAQVPFQQRPGGCEGAPSRGSRAAHQALGPGEADAAHLLVIEFPAQEALHISYAMRPSQFFLARLGRLECML